MTTLVAAVGSVVAGAALALVSIVGGVAAITPAPNAPSASEQVVLYDAP